MRWPPAVLLAATLAGCAVGKGEGTVVGSLWLPGCDGDQDLNALGRDAFDLRADYFVGQPVFDTDENATTMRDSLLIRIQHGGAPADRADTLSIQVVDVDNVRPGEVEDVMPMGCQRGGGTDAAGDPRGCVRATLAMSLRCPDIFENFEAIADDPTPADPDSGDETPCPSTVGKDAFAGDFGAFDDSDDPFWTEGPHPSCIAFQDIGERFGDEIAATFHFNVRDARMTGEASVAGGYLRGRFRFKLERGPGAQTFP